MLLVPLFMKKWWKFYFFILLSSYHYRNTFFHNRDTNIHHLAYGDPNVRTTSSILAYTRLLDHDTNRDPIHLHISFHPHKYKYPFHETDGVHLLPLAR